MHFIISLICSIILFPFIGYYAIIVFLAGFLIDVDHYFYYIIKNKDFSLKNSYLKHKEKIKKYREMLRNNQKPDYQYQLHIFHTIEFFMVLLALSFVSKIFFYILIGTIIHQVTDILFFLYERTIYPKELYDIDRIHSIIKFIFYNKKIK